MREALRLRAVFKRFGNATVLRDVALAVAPGEVVGLCGRSGGGKTTLLRIAAGLDADHGGRVEGRGRVAMAFQEPRLLPWRDAVENVTLATGATPRRALALIEAVGLADHARRHPHRMSLGQQRRLAFARAAALDADTILLDEPFASLDAETATGVRAVLRDLLRNSRARVLLATHDGADLRALCDRAVRLEDGRLVPVGVAERGAGAFGPTSQA